jgi:hypothetical protein
MGFPLVSQNAAGDGKFSPKRRAGPPGAALVIFFTSRLEQNNPVHIKVF